MKKHLIYTLSLVLALGASSSLTAQQEQLYSHYDYNSLAINPAYAGSKQTFVANSLARMQWLNLPGAPRYYNVGIHSPVVGDFGMGLNLQTGSLGKFQVASPMKETQIALSGAYNKRISENLRFAVGLRLGLYNYNVNLSQLQTDKANDIAFQNNDLNLTAPMTGFGLYLYSDKFFAGLSAPRMVFVKNNSVNNVDIEYATNTQYYAFAGYVIDVNTDVKLKPTTQIKMVQGAPMQIDLNMHLIYLDDYSIGGFYRTGGEAGIMAMANITPSFTIVYSYDSRMAPLNEYTGGSHEFGIQYMIPYISNSKTRVPRYF
ncbi:MAG: PorP/SprF family type IX secretion system membrane protein [Bacteroidia bacterium]|jgi:type IX secretion system PorP/SprF family membrane protein